MNYSKLLEKQRKRFQSGDTLPAEFRKEKLSTLKSLVSDNKVEICNAIQTDFGKPHFEAYITEIAPTLHEIDFHLKHIDSWVSPRRVKGSLLTFPSKSRIYRQPYGTVLIFGTWNYPFYLSLLPLIGAVSAGNTAILKPSEMAPATAECLASLIREKFDPDYLTVTEGGVETGEQLLEQKFDFIFFTGSERVGKKVLRAAADHLTPTVVELGGKSPAIVHHDADPELAAKRIWWGKCLNSGQTCVAPDFAAVHKDQKEAFIRHSKSALASFFSSSDPAQRPGTRIINSSHFQRLTRLIHDGNCIIGGSADPEHLSIEPTLILADWGDPPMKDEIFGPILPLVEYDEISGLIQKLRSRPSPLALYLFTKSRAVKEQIIHDIPFGGGCINDTVSHLGNPNLPFGGVGSSGFGAYHGEFSFNTFSYQKSILEKASWPDQNFRYPPYSTSKLNLVKKFYS